MILSLIHTLTLSVSLSLCLSVSPSHVCVCVCVCVCVYERETLGERETQRKRERGVWTYTDCSIACMWGLRGVHNLLRCGDVIRSMDRYASELGST